MTWTSREPQRRGRPPAHNLLKFKCPGPSKTAFNRLGSAPSELEVWKQLIDEDMIQQVFRFTQAHLDYSRSNASSSDVRNYYNTSIQEINAFIGLLRLCVLTSIYKSNRESLKSLFASGYKGRPIFRAIMSYRRLTCFLWPGIWMSRCLTPRGTLCSMSEPQSHRCSV